ncbi:MAG TPA: OmpA family protein [bacterium]|nr:OmpA family protein [bacterium]
MAEEESQELPGWVPLFTSLMILMCAFFILLVAYSSFDTKRSKKAIGSLQGTFGVSGSLGLFPMSGGASSIRSPKDVSKTPRTRSRAQKVRAFTRFCQARKGVRVQYSSKGIRIDTAERVLFDLGSAKLNKGSREFLTKVADLLEESQSRAIVEGHCDESDIKASQFASGWELSIERALSVTRFLIDFGIDPGKLSSYGYGQFNPLTSEDGDKQKFNRRVTMLIDIGDVQGLLKDSEERDGEEETGG